jgi:hypothetical protein
MKEWKCIPSTFSVCLLFFYEHIFYKLYVQVKVKFMKNKKIRECLHLFYIKIKNILHKRIKSFLNNENGNT